MVNSKTFKSILLLCINPNYGAVMEKQLFERLKASMKSFNTAPLFDIPLGGYTTGSLPIMAGRDMGPSIQMILKYQTILEQYAPNTRERWISAINLLRYMRYTVKWEDESKCPEVYWINTEGNGDAEAKMIDDIFNRDYVKERLAESKSPKLLDTTEMYELLKSHVAKAGHGFTIDSLTQDSTEQS